MIVLDDGVVVSHAAVVERTLDVGEERFRVGYVEGVGTSESKRRRGSGSLVMGQIAKLIRAHFELGALSTDEQPFYERLAWERWRGPSFVRRGTEVVRTEDEDTGLMVLRFGRSADVDLTASIVCEDRPGEAW